jgi:hypothetical protein
MARTYLNSPTIVKGRVVRKAGDWGRLEQLVPHTTPVFKQEKPASVPNS